jgi:hypothetical protein
MVLRAGIVNMNVLLHDDFIRKIALGYTRKQNPKILKEKCRKMIPMLLIINSMHLDKRTKNGPE